MVPSYILRGQGQSGYIYVGTLAQVAVVSIKIRAAGGKVTVWRHRGNFRVGSPDLDFNWFYHYIPTHQHYAPWCPWC